MARVGCDRDVGDGEHNEDSEEIACGDSDGDSDGDVDGDGENDGDGDSNGGCLCSPALCRLGESASANAATFNTNPQIFPPSWYSLDPHQYALSLRRSRHRSFGSNTGHPTLGGIGTRLYEER